MRSDNNVAIGIKPFANTRYDGIAGFDGDEFAFKQGVFGIKIGNFVYGSTLIKCKKFFDKGVKNAFYGIFVRIFEQRACDIGNCGIEIIFGGADVNSYTDDNAIERILRNNAFGKNAAYFFTERINIVYPFNGKRRAAEKFEGFESGDGGERSNHIYGKGIRGFKEETDVKSAYIGIKNSARRAFTRELFFRYDNGAAVVITVIAFKEAVCAVCFFQVNNIV